MEQEQAKAAGPGLAEALGAPCAQCTARDSQSPWPGDPGSHRHPPELQRAAEVPTPASAAGTFVSLEVILSP